MPMLVHTRDAAFAVKLTRTLRGHGLTVAQFRPDHQSLQIGVLPDQGEQARGILQKIVAKEPWRELSQDDRALFVRNHRGFLRDVAAAVHRTHQTVGRVWYGERSSRRIEAAITRAFAALTAQS